MHEAVLPKYLLFPSGFAFLLFHKMQGFWPLFRNEEDPMGDIKKSRSFYRLSLRSLERNLESSAAAGV